jgi:hypothetical protein
MATYFQPVSQKFLNIARSTYLKTVQIKSELSQCRLQFLSLGDFTEITLLFQFYVLFSVHVTVHLNKFLYNKNK